MGTITVRGSCGKAEQTKSANGQVRNDLANRLSKINLQALLREHFELLRIQQG
jgi:hypothetical protein